MTRELSSLLTERSGNLLLNAITTLGQDSYSPYNREPLLKTKGLSIGISWQVQENIKPLSAYLRSDKKIAEHLHSMDLRFSERVQNICAQRFDDNNAVAPMDWNNHFPDIPFSTNNFNVSIERPDKSTYPDGTLAGAIEWANYNLHRLKLHDITLAICTDLVTDNHTFEHLNEFIGDAKRWIYSKTQENERLQMQSVLLEGDPLKIQALREHILSGVARPNMAVSHFYGPLNRAATSSFAAEQNFKQEAIEHVQRGFHFEESSISMNDLGLE